MNLALISKKVNKEKQAECCETPVRVKRSPVKRNKKMGDDLFESVIKERM